MTEQWMRDIRHAVRSLARDRAFTITTLATLALCLAANAAIFAVVQAVLLRPLPFPEPERLVTMYNAYPGAGVRRGANGVPDYDDRRRETTAFETLALYRSAGATIGGDGADVERVEAMQVTPSFFPLLRATALRGRVFSEAEGERGQEKKVVLAYGLWQRLFAGRDDAIGATLRVAGEPYTVVGVMPAAFRFVSDAPQLWTPAAFAPADRADERRHSNSWQMLGRLAPGATRLEAQRQIDALNARNLERFPALREVLTNAGFHTPVFGFQDELVSDVRPTLWMLWAAAGFVLLIGALNVANLVSVRATAQAREFATRLALGASGSALTRQILTEAVLLTALGGALGVALGSLALRLTPLLGLDGLPRGQEIGLDTAVGLYSLALVALISLLVAVVPVLRLRHVDVAGAIREEGRSGTASRRTLALRRVLVAGQVAFALVLLVGAGMLLASFSRVLQIDPGFRADGVLTGLVRLPPVRYTDDPSMVAAYERLLPALRAIPGVTAAGLTTSLPLGGDYSDSVIFAEGYQMTPGESLVSPAQTMVTEGLMEALGMTLVRGRFLDARDVAGAPRAILVDERLARKFWPGQDPIGRRMYFPTDNSHLMQPPPDDQWLHVVGVVRDVRLHALAAAGNSGTLGATYLSMRQSPQRGFAVAIRTAQAPETITAAVRAAVTQTDANAPLFDVSTMAARVDTARRDRRTPMVLAVVFAAVALVLAAVGLYGVLAYQVAQRGREIGIRLALGATAPGIFQMVLGEGAAVVGAGVAAGLAGAWLLRTALQAQLYDVNAMDPGVLAAVTLLLAAVSLVAGLVPARRAAATDPARALVDR